EIVLGQVARQVCEPFAERAAPAAERVEMAGEGRGHGRQVALAVRSRRRKNGSSTPLPDTPGNICTPNPVARVVTGSTPLAVAAKKRRSLALHDAPDRCGADRTRLAFAPVDPGLRLEAALHARRVAEAA